MANTLLTPSVIAKEGLRILRNNLVMGGLVHRQYKSEFVKVGDTVTIRKPVKFVVSDGSIGYSNSPSAESASSRPRLSRVPGTRRPSTDQRRLSESLH